MHKLMKNFWMAFAMASAALWLADRAAAADLTVEVGNIKTKSGNILIAVYDKADRFLADGGMKVGMKLKASAGGVSHTFKGLDAGTYAVSVFHDVDSDGELNKNFMGIPQEPYGMSRGAVGRFGPPKFTDAAFELPDTGSAQKITLH